MTQPIYSECTGEAIETPVVVEDLNPGLPATIIILTLFVVVAIFEVWALKTRHNTISHLIQRISRGRNWFRWLAGIGMGVLTWHLLWGFPW